MMMKKGEGTPFPRGECNPEISRPSLDQGNHQGEWGVLGRTAKPRSGAQGP